MLKFQSGVAVALAALALNGVTAAPSWGAAIDDARAALAAKEYAKVDSILAGELKGKSPSAEALRASMDAAEASGKVVTAATRATALLKLTGEKDAELLFR